LHYGDFFTLDWYCSTADQLPFGGLWYGDASAVANATGYAQHYTDRMMRRFAITMLLAT
jgi:hypothetical protein